jgi:hypothetical protein
VGARVVEGRCGASSHRLPGHFGSTNKFRAIQQSRVEKLDGEMRVDVRTGKEYLLLKEMALGGAVEYVRCRIRWSGLIILDSTRGRRLCSGS